MGMFAPDVHGQDVFVFGRVRAHCALKLGFHSTNKLNVSSKVVKSGKNVTALEARMTFFFE